jgi:hypothetical protein
MAAQPMPLDAFRAAVFARSRRTPEPMTESQLSAALDPGVFHQFEEFSELMEQIHLISDALVKNCTSYDADLLAQQKELTFETFLLWQQSILGLPQAYVRPDAVHV